MKNRITKAGVSAAALGLLSLAACLGNSSSSDDGGAAQSTDDGGGSSGSSSGSASSSSGSSTSSSGSSSGSPSSSGDGGGSSSGTSSGGMAVAIMPDPNGYVGPSSNTLGIQGAWYGYGDDWGTNGAPPGDCEVKGMHMASQCSSITFPPPGMASDAGDGGFSSSFPQMTPGTMCLSGTAAKVIGSDYSNIFGIGIGLDFNNVGGVKMPWNATMNKVVGFSFTVAGLPTGASLRVEFPIPATDSAGSDSYAHNVTANGPVTIDLSTAKGDLKGLTPAFTPTGTEPAFDATKIESVQFHIPTNTMAAITIPMSTPLCISNFSAIVGP